VDLARELRLGPFEAKKLETSLKIFEGGGYRITTEPGPEVPTRKRKARNARPEERTPGAPESGEETEEGDEPNPPEAPEAPQTPGAAKPHKAAAKEPVAGKAVCGTHDAQGVERHTCGAWLCKACLESGVACPECQKPVGRAPRESRKRETDGAARDFGRL